MLRCGSGIFRGCIAEIREDHHPRAALAIFVDDEAHVAAARVVAPFGLAEWIDMLVAGNAEKQFDRIVNVAGGGRVEHHAGIRLDLERLGAECTADDIFCEIEPECLAEFELIGTGVDHLHAHRDDSVGGITGYQQIEVGDTLGDEDTRGLGWDFGRIGWRSGQQAQVQGTGRQFIDFGEVHARQFHLTALVAVEELEFFRGVIGTVKEQDATGVFGGLLRQSGARSKK